jgi:ABC-type nitrate/sulfonate/bicarbonate transport system substrate-binding protein
MAAALVAGRIDALYCMDPVATKLVSAKQADVLVQNPIGRIVEPPVPISGTLLSAALVKDRPKDARAVEAAIDKAIDYTRDQNNRAEMAGIVAKYTGATAEDIQRELVPRYWKRSETDRARLSALSNRFRELGIVPEGVSADRMILE